MIIRESSGVRVDDIHVRADQLQQHALSQHIEQKLAPASYFGEEATSLRQKALEQLPASQRITEILQTLRQGRLANLTPILPIFFTLQGKPYSLRNHFPFEALYNTAMPKLTVLKAGRQIAKSTNLSSHGVLMAATLSHFNQLFVTPLFEMVRRLSTNYVRPFIDNSPARSLFLNSSCSRNVLQRTFSNESSLFFSYCLTDADRTRGLSVDKLAIDEAQDIDESFIPIMAEAMSGRPQFRIIQLSGTPKSLSGCLENYWQQTSQAEWHIRCTACNKENIPSLQYDLDAMTGPNIVKRKISESSPGVVCARCGRPINPRAGGFVHHFPELRHQSVGYHLPQLIFPVHYADPVSWAELLAKRASLEEYIYRNEVCGESFDSGIKLITKTELQNACEDRDNSLAYAREAAANYEQRVVAVDWGGGGQDQVSYTVMALLGRKADNTIDVVFARRFRIMNQYPEEVAAILYAMREFKAHRLVHDFGGAGQLREQLLVDAGLDKSLSVPVSYVAFGPGAIMRHKPANPATFLRDYYQLDKARSLTMTCELIRRRTVKFFRYDFKPPSQPGVINDFLALVDEMKRSNSGGKVYTVIRDALSGPDDFAHAVNIGVCALFYMFGSWPNLAAVSQIQIDPELFKEFEPEHPQWDLAGEI